MMEGSRTLRHPRTSHDRPLASSTRRLGHLAMPLAAVWLAAAMAGCGTAVPGITDPGTIDVEDGNRDTTLTSSLGKTSGEPNDTFSQAVAAVFGRTNKAALEGSIMAEGDMDVYQLGALSAGDSLAVDTATTGSALDVSIGLFDGDQRLVYENDDRGGNDSSRFLDSIAEWTVRHSSNNYYLVVTHSAFADPGTYTGTYTIDITLGETGTVPGPTPQVLFLDFDGAVVDSPVLGQTTLGTFDAADISSIYSGQTETIKSKIVEIFEANFARFDVRIYTSDDVVPFGPELVSTIYFGGFNESAFGIAENVDLYNADFCDDAIIYIESFTPGLFRSPPSATEMGIVIGNVSAHEAGHVLGLNHVDDDAALMDDQSTADALAEDQEFMEAPLSTDIMPIGTQDAALLLEEIVGLSDIGAAQLTQKLTPRRRTSPGIDDGRVWVKRMYRHTRH